MNDFKKLRIGIIVDDTNQPYLVNDLYEKSLKSEYYSIECLIVQKKISIKNTLTKKLLNFIKTKGFMRLVDRLLFEFIEKLETYLIKDNNIFKKVFLKYPISKFTVQKIYVEPEASPSLLFYRYKDIDIEKIKELNLDLMIRGGSGILKGAVLDICKLGIISFHHGDNDLNRGGPPGFWEVLNREPSTGFIIQRLTEELDGGDVIFKGNIATSFMYKINSCKLYLKSSIFLHKTIEKLSFIDGNMKLYPKIPYAYPLYKSPKFYESILYLIKTFFLFAKKIVGKVLGFKNLWSVAYQFTNDWKSSVLRKSIIIKNPKNSFLADPFVTKYNDKTVLFVENFNFSSNKGVISAYQINPEGYKEIGVVIEEKFHLSYPFLIQNENNLFMIPESSQAKDIRIYKCMEFPLKWKLHKILINNISAADTNIIKYNNKYWMFTNIDSSNINDHSSELHIFYSDDLITTNWKPHVDNPVIFDSKQARNGGMIFSKDNELFRVFQKQDFDAYGSSLGIAKIKILTQNQYEEDILINIEPKFFKNIKRTHSFSYNANVLAIDFVRYEKLDK